MHKDLVYKLNDEEFINLFNESKQMKFFYSKLGFAHKPGKRSRERIDKRCAELGIIRTKITRKPKDLTNIINTNKKRATHTNSEKHCSCCGKEIAVNKTGLCLECYTQKRDNDKIKKWKETGDTGCSPTSTLRNAVRRYIYKKQNNKCAICGMKNEWNGKEIKFVLDHIDGNAANNKEENLRLICPNCDSQLPTFKSKNKNSARTHRNNK